jgi:antitoxin MazE
VRISLVNIGNSQGIRLPKAVIQQAGLTEELDLEVSGDSIIIRPRRNLRESWAEEAAACREAGEDQLDDWDATSSDFSGTWS